MLNQFLDRILTGNCLEVLHQIPDDSVDVCFADPPFNLKKKYTSYHDKKALEDYLSWCEKWLSELVRVTKPEGSIFVHNIPKWLTYFAAYLNQIAFFRHWISWDSMSVPLGKTLLPAHYGILYYTKQPNTTQNSRKNSSSTTCAFRTKNAGFAMGTSRTTGAKRHRCILLGRWQAMFGQIYIASATINAEMNTRANCRFISLSGLC